MRMALRPRAPRQGLHIFPDAELHVGHREVQLREEVRALRLIDEPVGGSTDRCMMALSHHCSPGRSAGPRPASARCETTRDSPDPEGRPPGLAGSRRRGVARVAGRQIVATLAGSLVAKKNARAGSLFESKNHHSHHQTRAMTAQ